MKSKEKIRWHPLPRVPAMVSTPDSGDGISPTKGPIQPEDVPKWNSNFKPLAWPKQHTPSTLPHNESGELYVNTEQVKASSPTSPTSLRDIMERETSDVTQTQHKKKLSGSGRVSWKDIKKQQSRASAQDMHLTKSSNLECKAECSSPSQSPRTPSSPWSSIGGQVKSFRDLMQQEEERQPSLPFESPSPRGQRLMHSETSQSQKKRSRSDSSASPQSTAFASQGKSPTTTW